MNRAAQFVLALAPLALTPVWVALLAEGWIDLGGGEKDLLWALPWAFGSLVFALCAGVLILRRWPPGRWWRRALAVTAGVLAAAFAALYGFSLLGVA